MFRSPLPAAAQPLVPGYIRADGGVRLVFGATGRGTRAIVSAENGGYRTRFPTSHDSTCEAILINTGGGMAGGDHTRVDAQAQTGTQVALTTQAAEKVYRAQGDATRVSVDLRLEPGASLAWLPQETILFDGARLARTLDVAMPADAALVLCETLVFGRAAMGERMRTGALHDRWRIRRDGRLVFAEDLRLEGDLAALLARPALAGGAGAAATVLALMPGIAARLDSLREKLADAPAECGLSALDGMLVARFLAQDSQSLRAALAPFLLALRGTALPRAWMT